ncbi:MAG TPA: hypothetical protein VL547_22710 [Dinghuibacter sp.]|uniref:hypothetical protein n=1 Tax=Dinghuibacter sp. TaxID=2024697 RepID=UPI002BF6F082|nr:hypothetical protein [Dinghuibacter sp.]HTJ14874.1 hypothetical protein [Dinghuibacter sp.]
MHSLICNGTPQVLERDDSIQPGIDKDYKTPNIPTLYAVKGAFGKILFYELKVKDFLIRYHLFELKENLNINIIGETNLPEIFIPLWAPFSYHLDDHGPIDMHLSQYSIRYLSRYNWHAFIPKTKQPSLLSVHFPYSFLQTLTGIFPQLQHFSANVAKGRLSIVSGDGLAFATTPMLQEAKKMLHCQLHTPELKELLLECILKAFLLDGTENLVQPRSTKATWRRKGERYGPLGKVAI